MNTNNIILPKEYPIKLAIDCYYYIDVHVFDSKLVKNAFARCRVPFPAFVRFNVACIAGGIVWVRY